MLINNKKYEWVNEDVIKHQVSAQWMHNASNMNMNNTTTINLKSVKHVFFCVCVHALCEFYCHTLRLSPAGTLTITTITQMKSSIHFWVGCANYLSTKGFGWIGASSVLFVWNRAYMTHLQEKEHDRKESVVPVHFTMSLHIRQLNTRAI